MTVYYNIFILNFPFSNGSIGAFGALRRADLVELCSCSAFLPLFATLIGLMRSFDSGLCTFGDGRDCDAQRERHLHLRPFHLHLHLRRCRVPRAFLASYLLRQLHLLFSLANCTFDDVDVDDVNAEGNADDVNVEGDVNMVCVTCSSPTSFFM